MVGKKKAKRVKRAWRKISTEDIDNFNQQATRDANSGGSLASAPNNSLFVLDKSIDVPVKRKIEKHREKVLRVDSILQRNPFVKPVLSSILRKAKKKDQAKAVEARSKEDDYKDKEVSGVEPGLTDLWGYQSADNIKRKKKFRCPAIPAVEVEAPGCSFNPDNESHKDSLAQAVAEEMKKIYKSELDPQPIPLIVPGEAITEEDRYFLEVDEGKDEEMEEDDQIDGDSKDEKRKPKEKRVTRVELNRRLRRKEQLRAEAEAKRAKELSKEIDSIPDILQEIAQEEEEKRNRHVRRVTAKEERLKSAPPRLGKRKFEPAPTQVLLTEDITGSLRKLKACCTLARDRFKSLEKRGLIVPSAKSSGK